MITFVKIIVVIISIAVLFITYNKLANYTKLQKILVCLLGTIISIVITTIIFMISSKGIEYKNIGMKDANAKMLISLFTPLNAIIIMPFIVRMVKEKMDNNEKDVSNKKILVIMGVIIIFLLILESLYLKSIQNGIINILNKMY